ncbi:MAG TPA: hypothetical protein VFZ77_06300 [Acidimicrobiales bacterium]
MHVLMVRSQVKAENVADVEAAVEKVFTAIHEAQPAGVRYATAKLSDGVTFVAMLELDDPKANPLVDLPAFTEFQASLGQWMAGPPAAEPLTVVGSYRLF